ncbi:hypothetical protein F5Y04DRAFT_250840 [Hypomontagnella monticulosa]|nr:hypothetical protein F5Y04DRAFT_250840 [Hypomontagnella monticulosa]
MDIGNRESYYKIEIENMPPSEVDVSLVGQWETRLTQNRVTNTIEPTERQKHDILLKLKLLLHGWRPPEDISPLIRECRSLNLRLDIDRLTRFAAYTNQLALVKYFVERKNANLTRQDSLGRSAIFYALWPLPDPEMLTYIMSKHWDMSVPRDINLQDVPKRRTLLHYASMLNHLPTIELLLDMGASREIEDKDGKTPIDILDFIPRYGRIPPVSCSRRVLPDSLKSMFFQSLRMLPHPTFAFFHGAEDKRGMSTKHLDQVFSNLSSFQNPPTNYKPNYRAYNWLHLPWTNGTIALTFLGELRRIAGYTTVNPPFFLQDPPTIPGNPDLNHAEPSYKSSFDSGPDVFIVFPCLVLRTRGQQRKMRYEVQDLRTHLMLYDPKMLTHHERTLDETYYPSLPSEALDLRNDDQVVSKEWAKVSRGVITDDNKPILTVPQLWLWRFKNCILTCQPTDNPECRKWPRFYYGTSWSSESHSSVGILTGLIIAHHIREFGQRQADGLFPSPLDIFEASVVQILTEVRAYIDPNNPSRPEMNTEHDFTLRISDVREELVMIEYIIGQQLDTLERLTTEFELHNPESLPFLGSEKKQEQSLSPDEIRMKKQWEEVKMSKNEIEKYRKRIKKIDADAERIEKSIQDQLNLKRIHVSINDARTSLILSTAVIGLTVITIIFAPLSFMTSLLDLPIDTFLKNRLNLDVPDGTADTANGVQTTAAYSTSYVGAWFAVAEVASLFITILLVIFSVWFLGGTKSFAIYSGDRTEKTRTRLHHPNINPNSEGKPTIFRFLFGNESRGT